MATKKKARAKAVSKRPKKQTASKVRTLAKKAVAVAKTLAKKAVAAAKRTKASALKPRKKPETLRVRSFTPSLTVNDLGKSLAFYTDGLGFIAGERWTDGDVLRGIMLKAGRSEFGLSQDDWKMGKDRKKGVGFRISCDTAQDLDAIAARLKAAGYSLTDEVADHPEWGVRSFSVDDPDGFHITMSRDI